MGRLIDTDELIESAKNLHIDDFTLLVGMVSTQPTAYDFEKVAEKIEGLMVCKYNDCENCVRHECPKQYLPADVVLDLVLNDRGVE